MYTGAAAYNKDSFSLVFDSKHDFALVRSQRYVNGNVTAIAEGFEVITLLFWGALFLAYLLVISVHFICGTLPGIKHIFRNCFCSPAGGAKCQRVQKRSLLHTLSGRAVSRSSDEKVKAAREARARDAAAAPPCGIRHEVKHLAVIMDGNRRYGERYATGDAPVKELEEVCDFVFDESRPHRGSESLAQRLSALLCRTKLDGHRVGGEKLIEFVKNCIEFDIRMLTVYAFSTENWARPVLEVKVLMTLFYCYFEKMRRIAKEHGIFIRFISSAFGLIPPRVQRIMKDVEEETRNHRPRRIVVNVCVSYSGRDEIVSACNALAMKANRTTPVSSEDIMGHMLRSITQAEHEAEDASVLAECGGAEPQVLLRTSGEQRLSNFLLFECAYTEFLFVNKTWPEVDRDDLVHLLKEHGKRDKRYGK
uniref:Putative cis-prenyltransferase-like protein n=1 Tax=Trypanosoma congolense (strain IL3000) TaxID=1068625 RepID=G0UQL3_TRYCI|nr:putative cis-prenyltransferase-like protein [Trypanosoma congolense IL3000]